MSYFIFKCFRTSNIKFFVGLNRVKKIQTLALFCFIPTCFGLNILGHMSLEELICISLVGTVLILIFFILHYKNCLNIFRFWFNNWFTY